MKRKNLLTILIAACLSLCVIGGLSATRSVEANAASTVQETSVTSIYVEGSRIWLGLSGTDYGGQYKGAVDSLASLNILNKIKVDGKYMSESSTMGDADPWINLWSKLAGSFQLVIKPKTELVIEKGCQFPSYDYWSGNADGVIYEVNETVTFNKTGDTWVKALPETDISDAFSAKFLNINKDSVVLSLTTTADISAPASGKWLMDNMTEIQNYITVNGKTVVEINAETDDSSYKYIEFPGNLNNGVHDVPVRVLFTKSGENAELRIYIHNDYFATLPSSFTVGIKAGFIRANTAATINMTVKTDVNFNFEKTNATAINLSDGLTGGAFANGYYHAYLYTDLFVNNTGIGYGIIDNPDYEYIAYHIFVNGKSIAEINAGTDTTGWDWKGSFPHTIGEKYEVPIMLYVSDNNNAAAADKGTTKLEFKFHENYIASVDEDITVTIEKGLTLRNNTDNVLCAVQEDVSGVIYYKSYSLTINIEGQDPKILDIKHTLTLDLSGFCPAKDGYTFSGWYTDAELITEATETTMPAEDYAVYGKYEAIEYTATITLFDGTEHTITYTIENRAAKLAEVKELLSEDNAQYSFTNDLPTELPLENGKTYTENREVRKYTVKIGYDDPFEVTFGSKLDKPQNDPVKTKEGYTCTFEGWFNGETEWDFENDVVTSDVTLVAKFTEVINKYTVKISFIGIEKAPKELTVEHGNTVDFTSYNEAGYDLVVKKGNDEITELTVTENVELTITYTKKAPEESSSESESDNESDIESADTSESETESTVESGKDSGSTATGGSGCGGSVGGIAGVASLLGLAALVVLKKKNK